MLSIGTVPEAGETKSAHVGILGNPKNHDGAEGGDADVGHSGSPTVRVVAARRHCNLCPLQKGLLWTAPLDVVVFALLRVLAASRKPIAFRNIPYLCRLRPMKVTHSLALVALTILQMSHEGDGYIWGYQLSKRSGVRSGVLYPQLDRMLDEGWLADHWEERQEGQTRPPRRYYTLTDAGRIELGAVAHRVQTEQRFSTLRGAFA